MARRSRHPNKEIEAAVAHAEALGWRVVPVSGHSWGRLYCAHHDRDGCMISEHAEECGSPCAGRDEGGEPLPASGRE